MRADRAWLARPLAERSRWSVLLLLPPLLLALIAPLWRLEIAAPELPEPLELVVFSYTVSGDVAAVNALHEAIGMKPIDAAALSRLGFLPFAIGALALLLLRVVAFADLRALVDAIALYAYFGAFAFARFASTLYVFGHDLDPAAPVRVEPFTPAVLGTGSVATFTITSLPARGSFYLAAVGTALAAVLLANLRRARAASGG